MNKIVKGLLFGAIAGVIDVIPMVAQGLSWEANLSAFAMWVVAGFLISTSELRIFPILKGILVAFLIALPVYIIVGAKEPFSLIPMTIMTAILGGILGKVVG
ncbi:hypothetical protein A3K48_02310 [candidate division WOR-1 bacterium RIFOXYA12_FULL_52_29]|uniref:Uncharacterized protein n=1 Tax=candidate division WOR-1 bacterium RIFOXYC12_FULL_54_18 TaxID=1802584 RepID=A0A1F4T808_UNCSA|nr:MAG: hypothetical protein A3K44_02310 [candidate division WOR-1 bacterium RIFOXYA2_FULL_51_19]OGC18475.1 MAG: hypothetical protein A3K48_02310 [candidate division WOR-1 bacterium RIFOXYA12_FULL_52_29]OGC27330.1 MAG: hypothetical protein A3K32_02305 [candidate division WOR-1 bacterium RIFOXYB2_FULL_45_9]OGC28892.1 MAG: hypothetical protein A3K49_02310 [candidate division WOR-1 bacterium RIFOXYC12_FULL_54_18]OGC30060.1 MAG: hypothetical protein A2346_04025 [candidate division WOR-1 bacterium R